jgi:hypothetical protein
VKITVKNKEQTTKNIVFKFQFIFHFYN